MGIDSLNDITLQNKINTTIDYCYNEACLTGKYSIWWDKMKDRITTLVRTCEGAKIAQLKRDIITDEMIVNPSSGQTQDVIDRTKARIKARCTDKRQDDYLVNKSMDQLEGSKMTRYQFRTKNITTYISSQVAKIKDKLGQVHLIVE